MQWYASTYFFALCAVGRNIQLYTYESIIRMHRCDHWIVSSAPIENSNFCEMSLSPIWPSIIVAKLTFARCGYPQWELRISTIRTVDIRNWIVDIHNSHYAVVNIDNSHCGYPKGEKLIPILNANCVYLQFELWISKIQQFMLLISTERLVVGYLCCKCITFALRVSVM